MEYDAGTYNGYQGMLAHVRADKVLRTITARQLDQFDISMMEWLLLGIVHDKAEGSITLSDIATALDVSQPQVTALMNKMVTRKLVRQKINRKDRRSRTVLLTVKGIRLLEQIETATSSFMDTWLSEVPKEQWQAYVQIVSRIADYKL